MRENNNPPTDSIEELRARLAASETRAETAEARAETAEALANRERRRAALLDGTFFSTIDDVWRSEFKSIQDPDLFGLNSQNLFSLIRTHDVVYDDARFDANRRYEKTVIAADDESADAAFGNPNNSSSVASSSSRSRLSASGVNIFGEPSTGAESAHLLPHASSCSKYWIPLVPWVLCTQNIQLSWDFMQKCIHGTLTQTADGRSGSKHSHVGIKHFPTNRIRLNGQKDFLDKYPCVILVPLLPLEEVRNWNGVAYEAIVLAGGWDCTVNNERRTVTAAEAYAGIRAFANMQNNDNFADFLATVGECNDACLLLKQYIFYVVEAFCSIHVNVNLISNNTPIEITKFVEWKPNLYKESAPVPVRNAWGVDGMKVRKVSFAASTSPVNPAPDPVLLLAKAASNWLKRHDFAILPGCGDDDSTSRSDDCADSAISYSEEESMQGRSRTAKKPCIAEVNINVNRDEVEEPLSDDEFLFDK
jgi:hypothetical protein